MTSNTPLPVRPAAEPPDARGDVDGDGNEGRGLLLVAALTDRWGWFPCADGPGKTVWAVVEALSVQDSAL
ncbi:ATP-binding protein [Streptomyces sp. NBC_00726]|uniref:ATP-binding protein n=1 Tax=Streptomyces sp. NBC_00726 TaxID=2903674 RepID=UPI003870068F